MQRIAAASQPGSNKLGLRVGWSSVIAQVDVLRVVFNRSVWRLKPPPPPHPHTHTHPTPPPPPLPSPPPPLVVMLKVNKSLSGPDDSIH